MAYRYVSAFNSYLPAATGQVISYVRDPKAFKLNKYVQYIESPANLGYYYRINPDNAVRIVADADFVWADGADRPQGSWNLSAFDTAQFACKRRGYPFRIGEMALKASKGHLPLLEYHTGQVMSQGMTNRTNRVVDLLELTTNWVAGGVNMYATANDLNDGAGTWDLATDDPQDPHYNAIKKTLGAAALRVNLATNGLVKASDLVLVISPDLARRMGNSAEVHNYVKAVVGDKRLEDGGAGDEDGMLLGLPPRLYGFEIVVENSPIVTSRPTVAQTGATRLYVKNDDTAFLISRKGGINGHYGAKSFSTVQLYWHEWECAIEVMDDPVNKRTDGTVIDNFAEVLAAPEAGFLIQSVL